MKNTRKEQTPYSIIAYNDMTARCVPVFKEFYNYTACFPFVEFKFWIRSGK